MITRVIAASPRSTVREGRSTSVERPMEPPAHRFLS